MINKIKHSALNMLESFEARQLYRESQKNRFGGVATINRMAQDAAMDAELDRKIIAHIDLILGEDLGSYYISRMPPNNGYLITEDKRHHVIRSIDDLREYVFRDRKVCTE